MEARIASARDSSQLADPGGWEGRVGRDPEAERREGRWPESERRGVAVWLEKERVAVKWPGLGAFTDWKAVTSIFWLLLAMSCPPRTQTQNLV